MPRWTWQSSDVGGWRKCALTCGKIELTSAVSLSVQVFVTLWLRLQLNKKDCVGIVLSVEWNQDWLGRRDWFNRPWRWSQLISWHGRAHTLLAQLMQKNKTVLVQDLTCELFLFSTHMQESVTSQLTRYILPVCGVQPGSQKHKLLPFSFCQPSLRGRGMRLPQSFSNKNNSKGSPLFTGNLAYSNQWKRNPGNNLILCQGCLSKMNEFTFLSLFVCQSLCKTCSERQTSTWLANLSLFVAFCTVFLTIFGFIFLVSTWVPTVRSPGSKPSRATHIDKITRLPTLSEKRSPQPWEESTNHSGDTCDIVHLPFVLRWHCVIGAPQFLHLPSVQRIKTEKSNICHSESDSISPLLCHVYTKPLTRSFFLLCCTFFLSVCCWSHVCSVPSSAHCKQRVFISFFVTKSHSSTMQTPRICHHRHVSLG